VLVGLSAESVVSQKLSGKFHLKNIHHMWPCFPAHNPKLFNIWNLDGKWYKKRKLQLTVQSEPRARWVPFPNSELKRKEPCWARSSPSFLIAGYASSSICSGCTKAVVVSPKTTPPPLKLKLIRYVIYWQCIICSFECLMKEAPAFAGGPIIITWSYVCTNASGQSPWKIVILSTGEWCLVN